MDNFTTLANKILTEQRDIKADQIEKLLKKGFEDSPFNNKEDKPESPFDRPDTREYSDQMEALTDDIFDAIRKKDKQAHLAVLRKYNAIRDKAIQRFGPSSCFQTITVKVPTSIPAIAPNFVILRL